MSLKSFFEKLKDNFGTLKKEGTTPEEKATLDEMREAVKAQGNASPKVKVAEKDRVGRELGEDLGRDISAI